MEDLRSTISQLLVLGIVVYGLLLVVGSPFGGSKLANSYARWVIGLPFRLVSRLLFGKKRKKKNRKK
ncbi:MAG: hypothetical protein A3D48_04125 [Candidatus Yanofskybacteria bacterium RIFCSPHIGHO2_02_FULL_43_17]|nr:MAG: hypothetical protein A3D48_04125 [Candidatus Yanofskybacteria bacterium RIFCSPHIGHO2_02_FULL_43_17]